METKEDFAQRTNASNLSTSDLRRILGHLGQHPRPLKFIAAGLVLAIGSSGLLLGGVTVAISSVLVMVMAGFDLLSAMKIGFFTTGTIGAAVGLLLAVRSIRFLTKQIPNDLSL
ncbi:MAG TPA: hypothetical protein VIV64_10965 [Gammaproteobacteria bacterium]